MRLLQDDPVHRFSHVSPIYNWIYPMAGSLRSSQYGMNASDFTRGAKLSSEYPRALYVHIPFCETICTFCPLVKGPLANPGILEDYVQALLIEIAQKGRDPELTRLPIRAIFFGGGTPSLLHPNHILKIGQALRKAFDLSTVEEFSIEMELKSISSERASAFRQIGATHARFGLQTFSPRHRHAFNLTADIATIKPNVELLQRQFAHVSCDMLYGLNGQTAEEFLYDIEQVLTLGLSNIDFYPLNIYVTQKKFHDYCKHSGMPPISGLTKIYMASLLRKIMHANGYIPHNGHGFVKVTSQELRDNPVVTRCYAFKYHQHVYGPDHHEYIGIGNSAQSYLVGRTIANVVSRTRYIKSLLCHGFCPATITDHADTINAAKAIAITLPYLGSIERSSVRWENLPEETCQRLAEVIDHGLVEEGQDGFHLTRDGWLWYVNLMYYLSPKEEQAALGALILHGEESRLLKGQTEMLTVAE